MTFESAFNSIVMPTTFNKRWKVIAQFLVLCSTTVNLWINVPLSVVLHNWIRLASGPFYISMNWTLRYPCNLHQLFVYVCFSQGLVTLCVTCVHFFIPAYSVCTFFSIIVTRIKIFKIYFIDKQIQREVLFWRTWQVKLEYFLTVL